jgi:signal peptidase II
MQKASCLQDRWRHVAFFLTAVLIIVADQLSKIWIRASLPDVGQQLFEIGFFRIVLAPPNTGAAFGLFQGHQFALTIFSIVAIAVILGYALFIYRRFPLLDNTSNRIALGLILGGTIGNLIDRLNPNLDGVTDFISIGTWWPAFNIADSAVTIGAIVFAYSLLRLLRAEKR